MRDDADLSSHHIEGFSQSGEPVKIPLISHIDGNLWTGGCFGGVWLPEDFQYVLSLYLWEEYQIPDWTQRITAKMYDANRIPDEALLYGLADLAGHMVRSGKTLIHCQAGLNRSGLVAALMLIRTQGMEPDAAISLLRERRDHNVLCNTTFENWLRSQSSNSTTKPGPNSNGPT